MDDSSRVQQADEAHQARIQRGLRRMAFVSWLLDDCIRVPGTNQRMGLDGLLGVIPAAGDVLTALVQFYLLLEAGHIGVQRPTLLRMLGNIVIDTTIGCIPIVGDLFDVLFKASSRNLLLARQDLGLDAHPDGARPGRDEPDERSSEAPLEDVEAFTVDDAAAPPHRTDTEVTQTPERGTGLPL